MRGSELSFPWNLPLNTIEMLVSFTLTVSGFLIGTASFVSGLYIREYEELASKEKLMSFVFLITSLIVPPLGIISLDCVIVLCSCQPLWLILHLLLILLVPVVPCMAIVYILRQYWPRGGSSTD